MLVCKHHPVVRDPTVSVVHKLATLPVYLHAAACELAKVPTARNSKQPTFSLHLPVRCAADADALASALLALPELNGVHEVALIVHPDMCLHANAVHKVQTFVQSARRLTVPVHCTSLKVSTRALGGKCVRSARSIAAMQTLRQQPRS